MAIKRVTSSAKTNRINNDLISEQQLINRENQSDEQTEKKQIPVEESLEREKSRYHYLIKTKKLELIEKIKQVVMAYNQVMFQIVRLEEVNEVQYDQYIQHFFMSKHGSFLAVGINIQKSIYLEFNIVEIRNAISEYGTTAIDKKLFAENGLFWQLLKTIDLTMEKINNSHIDFGKSGRRFDIKG